MSFRFREFKVYQDSKLWISSIFDLTMVIKKSKYFELSNQVERASISVIMNIAEGSDRGSDKDFNRFLDISLGSLNEVIAGLDIAQSFNLIPVKDFTEIVEKSQNLAKQLGGFKKYLKKL